MDSLLEEVKNYLNITWDDPNTNGNLNKFINSGKSYLNEIAGNVLDFSQDLFANQLLLDYCRYAYNHSLELFQANYKNELLKLSIREGVKAHVENVETSS